MRVLYVSSGLYGGGAETQLSRTAMGVRDKGHEVLVVSFLTLGVKGRLLQDRGIEVRALNLEKKPWKVFGQLRKIIKEFKPDIVHSFMWHANIASRFGCIGLPAKNISSLRVYERAPIRDTIEHITRPLATHYTTNSETVRKAYHLSKKRATVIYNGVPDSFWKDNKRKPEKNTALMIAKFSDAKDHETVIRAGLLLPEWTFSLVGAQDKSEYAQKMKKLIKDLGASNVHFLGYQSDVPDRMSRTQLSLLLTYKEGSPNVVQEAMLQGVPVIASDIPEVRELLKGGRGTLIKRDPKVLAQEMKKTAKLDRQAKKAMSWARKKFTIPQLIENTLNVYKQVMRNA